jgi:hypothetical protein
VAATIRIRANRLPLSRVEQPHTREPDRHHWRVSLGKTGWRTAFVKKSDLRRVAGILTEAFERLAPGGLRSAIELAKVKNPPHLRWAENLPARLEFELRKRVVPTF